MGLKIVQSNKSKTVILSCACQHEYQDKKYGKEKRVFNITLKGARCTVCGASKTI